MAVKVFYFIAVLSLASSLAVALHCYGCIASDTSDCMNGVIPSLIRQECKIHPKLNRNHYADKSVFLKEFIEEHKHKPIEPVCVSAVLTDFSPQIAERGCGYIFKDVDICKFLQKFVNVSDCSYCNSDFCNSAPLKLE